MRHAKPFVAPEVTVAAVTPAAGFDTIAIVGALDSYEPPLAPAGLYDTRTQREEAAQLHKLVHSDAAVHTFYTFPPHRVSSELVGQRLVYRPWWTPRQLELVIDTALRWEREQYPADGDHSHCGLTWETITAPMEAYRCGDTWITVDAYERFIRDDTLHYRKI
jgi:hypothetical protein